MFTHPEGTYLCIEITVECLTYILSADDGVDSFFPSEGKLLYCLFVVYCCRFFSGGCQFTLDWNSTSNGISCYLTAPQDEDMSDKCCLVSSPFAK